MKIRAVITFLLIICLSSMSYQAEARARFLSRLLGLADDAADAAKVTAKVAVLTAARDILKVHPSLRNAHVLSITNGQVFAENVAGNKLLIASTGSTGVLTLSPDAMALLRSGSDLIVSKADLGNLTDVIKQAINVYGKTVKIIYENGKIERLIAKQVNGSNILLAEAYSGVFSEVGGQYSDDLIWALQQNFHSADIKVISLFDETDADVLRHLDSAIGELHNPAGNKNLQSIIKLIGNQNQKNIFIVGHIENNDFVVRDASGNIVQKILISDLETAAKEADSSLFLLGCSAGFCSHTSGFIDPVNAIDVAKGLKSVIGQTSFGDALSALSKRSGDIVVRPQLVDSVRLSVVADNQMLQKGSTVVAVTATRISMPPRIRAEELASRIIPLIPSWIQHIYITGCVFLLFLYKKLIKIWRDGRMPAPRFKHRPLSCIGVHIIRSCGFILLVPFACVVAIFSIIAIAASFFAFYGTLCFVLMLFSIENILTVSIISFAFGWKYWKEHCYKIEDESRSTKSLTVFLTISVFYLVTVLLTHFFIHWDLSFGYIQSDFSFILIITHFIISVLIYAILKKVDILLKLIILLIKSLEWLLSELNDFRLPFILIEYPVTFIIYNQKKEINNE